MSKQKSAIEFKIENDWQPTRVYEPDEYLLALIETAKKLKPNQSIPISVAELQKRYRWKSANICINCLRYALAKKLSSVFMAKLAFHKVKNGYGKIDQVRIRHKNLIK